MKTPETPGALLRRTMAGAVAALLTLPAAAPAQVEAVYRISQQAAITQHIAGTVIGLEYSRPAVRGRADLFGGLVHWGEVWTPGANEATVLELSDTVEMEGHELPAGRWSMWMIPSAVGSWELLLHPEDSLFHTQRPDIGADGQIRFPIRTETGDHVELLTWSFPEVTQTGATLAMAWGTTVVPLAIEVDANLPVITVSEDDAARYVGEWEVTFLRAPDGTPATGMPAMPLTIRAGDGGTLVLEYPPELMAPPPGAADAPPPPAGDPAQARERAEARRALASPDNTWFDVILVPRAEGVFLLGFVETDGTLLDIEHVFHEFELEDGRAVRFEVRAVDDQLLARGERKR